MNFATKVPYDELIRNALILAKIHKYDVYNCLNLMDNSEVFEKLNFQKGDGHLNYYFYNWIMKRKHIEPKQLGVVLF
jgi:glycylpeptide N-tetradecanoyltransferase